MVLANNLDAENAQRSLFFCSRVLCDWFIDINFPSPNKTSHSELKTKIFREWPGHMLILSTSHWVVLSLLP